MQDVQPINGFINGSRVLLRRLTNHQQQSQQQGSLQMQPPQQPSLKCPRCDSINTKFCYYNNYNLSQPRHFCKNCRRYWTKGGVLRNVPVGGGCRKSKRGSSSSSKHNKSSSSSSSSTNLTVNSGNHNSFTSTNNGQNSHSSSDNSSAVGGPSLFHLPEVKNCGISSDLFSGEIEGFMNLITENKNNDIISVAVDEGNTIGSTASFSEFLQSQEWDMGKLCGGVHHKIDLVDPIEDLLQNRGSNVGLATLDWNLTADNNNNNNNQGNLFDVPDNVDQSYWNQSTAVDHHHPDSQWSDSAASHLPLFLP